MEDHDVNRKKGRLDGERIYLKLLTEDDVTEEYCSWINNPEINQFLVVKSTAFDAQIKYVREKYHDPGCLFYGIFLREADKHIGNVKLEPLGHPDVLADISVIVGCREYWGKGYSTEAYVVFLQQLFAGDIISEITTGVMKGNIGAYKITQKIGFKVLSDTDDSYKMLLRKHDFKFLDS